MLHMRTCLLSGLTLLSILAGCSDGTVGRSPVTGDLSASEMADVAMESDTITENMLGAELDATGMVAASTTGEGETTGTETRDVTFSRTRSCPGGGQVQVEGSLHVTLDRETRTVEAEASGSRTRTDCVFHRAEHTVKVNAFSQWDAFRRRVEGSPDGPQTTHYSGSWMVVRDDGEERSCEFDITIVRDPASRTRTLDGVICGTTVHRSVTWSGETS